MLGTDVANAVIAGHRNRPGRSSQLGEPEVEQLRAGLGQHDVGGLEIAVDDALPMRLVEGVGDLGRDLQRLVERERPLLEAGGERLPVEMRHDEEVRAVGVADVVDAADMRMIERRDGARLALEPRAQVGIAGDVRREDLDGDAAIEPRVAGFVDFAHAASTQRADDFIRTETRASGERHGFGVNILYFAGPERRIGGFETKVRGERLSLPGSRSSRGGP